jgi:hypothetical protein
VIGGGARHTSRSFFLALQMQQGCHDEDISGTDFGDGSFSYGFTFAMRRNNLEAVGGRQTWK